MVVRVGYIIEFCLFSGVSIKLELYSTFGRKTFRYIKFCVYKYGFGYLNACTVLIFVRLANWSPKDNKILTKLPGRPSIIRLPGFIAKTLPRKQIKRKKARPARGRRTRGKAALLKTIGL